jgi:hypothetical protein
LALIGNSKSPGQDSDLDITLDLIDKKDQGSIERSIVIGGPYNDAVRLNRTSTASSSQNNILIGGWTFSYGKDSTHSNIYLQRIQLDDPPFCGAKASSSNMTRSALGLTDEQYFALAIDSVSTHDSLFSLTAEPFPLSSTTLCESLGLRADAKKSFKISPNPADERIFIRNPNGELKRITIYDLSGKVIDRLGSLNGSSVDLHIGDKPNGVYIVEMLDHERNVVRKKLIVRHDR